jgi:two-component system, OmpR family, phosphate regulon response regulator PhoB
MKVLIVDDQPELRKLIRLTLQLKNWDLFEGETGAQALSMATALRPDLILLDVMMPGMLDGLQACSAIKSDDQLKSIKVVLLTARAQKEDIAQGLRAHADAYLVKPFSPMALLELIEKFVFV